MDISPGPPFWRILPDDMDIPLLDHLALSGRPDADIHSRRRELRLYGVLRSSQKAPLQTLKEAVWCVRRCDTQYPAVPASFVLNICSYRGGANLSMRRFQQFLTGKGFLIEG